MACEQVRLQVQDPSVRIKVACQGLPGPAGTPGGTSPVMVIQTDSNVVPGTPVYVTAAAHVDLAIGTVRPLTQTIGLSTTTTGAGAPATIQTQDHLVLTTLEWDAVTGQVGGLTPGAIYYLDQTTAGMLMTTAPVGAAPASRFNSRIGIAVTNTRMDIQIRTAIKLS